MSDDPSWWYRFKQALDKEFEEHKREVGYYDNPEVKIRDIEDD